MKYYIAYPGPIELIIKTINSTLKVEAVEEEINNQVCSFESEKSLSDLQLEVDSIGDDLWLLEPDELEEWLS